MKYINLEVAIKLCEERITKDKNDLTRMERNETSSEEWERTLLRGKISGARAVIDAMKKMPTIDV